MSTKNKERAKLSRDNDIIWGNNIEKNIRISFKNNNGNNPKPPEGNKTLILEKLVKLSIKHFKIGCSLIKNHQIVKGTVHISFPHELLILLLFSQGRSLVNFFI